MTDSFLKPQRILSLDVFRGLTILVMILVNAQGSQSVYPLLEHASWNGGSLADLVFPFFLFIVGLTTVIVLNRQMSEVEKAALYKSIFQRSLILFALGLFINVFPRPIHIEHLRVYGVLQRIALCYLVGAMLYLNTSVKTQILIFLAILVGYWFLLTQVPVPGIGVNQLTQEGSWASYIDQRLFSANHLYGKVYDPEGLLGTIPSIGSTLMGMITGRLLLSSKTKGEKCWLLFGLGLLSLLLALVWNNSFPINKSLWTSSFVLWSGGYALLTLSVCYFIIEILAYKKWSWPLKIMGMNALFLFVLHVLLIKLQSLFTYTLSDLSVGNLRFALTEQVFGQFSPQNAGVLYALVMLLLNFVVAVILYRRKIFIRI